MVAVGGDDTAGGGESGSLAVFLRTGTAWATEANLVVTPGTTAGDLLGQSVAVDRDATRIVAGAVGEDPAGNDSGAARVFLRIGTAWTAEARLVATAGTADAYFGQSVDMTGDGTRVLVTAYGPGNGVGYVFSRAGTAWTQEAMLTASDGSISDNFGACGAISEDGSRAVVGAPYDDTATGTNAGSVRVFVRTGTTWAAEATLVASDGETNDTLGFSVAISADGSRVLAGAVEDDTTVSNTGSGRLFVRTGTVWAQDTTLVAADREDSDRLGSSASLTADGSRALVGAVHDDRGASIDSGSVHVFTIAAPIGSPCMIDGGCVSGFCTDGVCCASRCSTSSTDCQACAMALTGVSNGTCGALSPAVAPTVTCRAAADVCDTAEVCSSASTSCPTDALVGASTTCRAAVSTCDVAEACTGASVACPSDAFAAAGTSCRAPTGCEVSATCNGTTTVCPPNPPAPTGTICRPAAPSGCDAAELCDGTSTTCPAVNAVAPSGTTCRASLGACDPPETCDGTSAACPGDVLSPNGTACGGSGAGSCSTTGNCNGSSPACPGATLFPAGRVCLAAPAGDPCDVDDTCDGVTDACQPRFATAGTVCAAAGADVCDAPDVCAGTSADCIATFLSAVECRTSAGPCDVAEQCSGTSASCPADVLLGASVVCRASTEPTCDPVEACDGASATCPADVVTCGVDGGSDVDAGVSDGGALVDAAGTDAPPAASDTGTADTGSGPPATAGCSCRTAPRSVPWLGVTIVAVLLLGRGARRP